MESTTSPSWQQLANQTAARVGRPPEGVCPSCGGGYEEEEAHGQPCGLCFPLTPAHTSYLSAFTSWLYASAIGDADAARVSASARMRALDALLAA